MQTKGRRNAESEETNVQNVVKRRLLRLRLPIWSGDDSMTFMSGCRAVRLVVHRLLTYVFMTNSAAPAEQISNAANRAPSTLHGWHDLAMYNVLNSCCYQCLACVHR